MNVETRDIAFSFEQPETVLNPLRNVTQQMLSQPTKRTAKLLPLINERTVLIVDAQRERAGSLAQLLSSVGYHPVVVSAALEAFTLFLQKTYTPFVIVLGLEDASAHFFLHRLTQQISQKYDWDVPIIRLRNQRGLPAPQPVTAPIKQLPKPAPSSGAVTTPISPASAKLAAALQASLATTETPPTHKPLPTTRTTTPARVTTTTKTEEHRELQQLSLEGLDIGRFQIQNRLGNTLSNTYRAYDRLREQYVALKAIQTAPPTQHPAEAASAEPSFFQREKEILDTLNHPHILSIANCGKSYISGAPFVYKTVLYCAKGSLASWQRAYKATVLSPKEIVQFISQLGDALQHAHDHNILYLNFKFSNILLRGEGSDIKKLHGFLIDFAAASHVTSFTKPQGTFPYTAPECWNGKPLPVSDQYGLAAITYELLTGRPPFQGQSEYIMKHLHTTMPAQAPSMYNRHVSPQLDKVLLRALAKKPEDRFGSMIHFVHAFQHYC